MAGASGDVRAGMLFSNREAFDAVFVCRVLRRVSQERAVIC
jgi:hypothetical protein